MRKTFNKYFIFSVFLILLASNSWAAKNKIVASVTDGTGRTVSVLQYPQKIVALGPAATEILFAVGAQNQIAAVDSFSDFPPEAINLPKVGGFDPSQISIETILSFKPDLIIAYSGIHDSLLPVFDQFNLTYYVSDVKTVEGVITEILNIAELTGHKQEGLEAEEFFRAILSNIKITDQKKPTVYYEIWPEPRMSIGNTSYINSIIEYAQGENIFAYIPFSYVPISDEEILAKDPDIIILPGSNGVTITDVLKRPGWENLSAVKNNRLFIINDDFISRPSPRTFSAIPVLNKIFYE